LFRVSQWRVGRDRSCGGNTIVSGRAASAARCAGVGSTRVSGGGAHSWGARCSLARRGITLFEAVASVAIVGVTAAAALSAVGSQFRTTVRAQRALTVEALATSRLDFLDLLDGQNALTALPDSVAKGEFPAPLDEYTWTTDVTPISDEPGLYSVVVKVLWADGSYELKSRAYRRPPLNTGNR